MSVESHGKYRIHGGSLQPVISVSHIHVQLHVALECSFSNTRLNLCISFCIYYTYISVCSDECVAILPENVSHLMLQKPTLTLEYQQLRLFPNITFNCDGSIVGWSMIAPQHTARGGLTELSVWTQISESGTFRKTSSALLSPCIRTVISAEDNMYLHENILEEPMEFHSGNILGMLLRPIGRARFPPYFMSKESFVSTFSRAGSSPANDTENTSGESDDKFPLISLVICKSSL